MTVRLAGLVDENMKTILSMYRNSTKKKDAYPETSEFHFLSVPVLLDDSFILILEFM